MAARSLRLTSTLHHPAHSGSRSTMAGRIASQAATIALPGTGAASSPTKPRGVPVASSSSSSPSGALVASTNRWMRLIGKSTNRCG